MNKKLKILLSVIIIFLTINLTKSQTGVFYFSNSSIDYHNTRVISLKEAKNKEIYLLGKSSNANYEKSVPYFARIDKKGNLLLQKNLEATSLYDIKEMAILPSQYIQIYGSEKKAGKFVPYIRTINSHGNLKTTDSDFSIYSTLINDLAVIDDNHIIVTETKLGKEDKYNINIYQYNLKTNKQVWYKKISSEVNEEADQVLIDQNNNIIVLGKKYNEDMTVYVPIIYKLDSTGNIKWKKGITVPENFYTHGIAVNSKGKLFYTCNYSRESTGSCESRIISIASTSEELQYETLQDISANGIISLKDDLFFIYGSNILVTENRVITKAKYLVINENLEILKSHEMSDIDVPDKDFIKGKGILPSSSDILTAIQLSDGRIACGGRIFMPENTNPEKILTSPRQNNAYLLFIDSDGNL